MWGTGLTAAWTGEGSANVFIAVDHSTAKCIELHASTRAARFKAMEPIHQGVCRWFGGLANAVVRSLAVERVMHFA
jgi:hypothetical protein